MLHFDFYLGSAVNHQILFLQSKRSHRILRRVAEVTKDADDVAACYRTISVLADRFLVSCTIQGRVDSNTPLDGNHVSCGEYSAAEP